MNNPSLLSTFNTYSEPISEELIAAAIAGLVNNAHVQGESLADLTQLVLEDDQELDWMTRQWLCEIVTETWQELYAPELYAPELYAPELYAPELYASILDAA